MKRLTLTHRLIEDNEVLNELNEQGYRLVGETKKILYYKKDNDFALYSKEEQKIVRQFTVRDR